MKGLTEQVGAPAHVGERRAEGARVVRQPYTMNGERSYLVLDRNGVVIYEARVHPIMDAEKVESLLNFLLADHERRIDAMVAQDLRSGRRFRSADESPLPSESSGIYLVRS